MNEWDGNERRDPARASGRDKCASCQTECTGRGERAFHDPCSGCACRAFTEQTK